MMLFLLFSIPKQSYGSISLVLKAVDVNGNPVQGVYITLVAPPPGAYVIGGGYTNEDGIKTFELNNPPETIKVFASWMGVIVYQSKLSPYIGSEILSCKIGNLEIRVLTKSLDPVHKSKVTISWNTALGVKALSDFTDEDGVAEFKEVPLITYNLSVYFNNKELYSGRLSSYNNQVYNVLIKLYSLKLQVLDSSGRVLPDVPIYLRRGSSKSRYTTGADGMIFVHYLTPGNYTVEISYMGIEKTLTVDLNQDEFIKVTLPKVEEYVLTIHVLNNLNNPLPYAKITIDNVENPFEKIAYTDENGNFIIMLVSGSYQVKAEYNGVIQYKEVKLNNNKVIKFTFNIGEVNPSSNETISGLHIFPYLLLMLVLVFVIVVITLLFHYYIVKART